MGKLFQDSGSTPDERRAEATSLVEMVSGFTDQMTDREQSFVEQMGDDNATVSPKQLFWLRDIKDKYI